MKTKEIITEAKIERTMLLDKGTINILHGACSDFLDNAKKPLFRGLQRDIRGLVNVPIRKNREPKDSEGIDTAAFNYLFELNTGIRYIRNSSAFTTTNVLTAGAYGQVGMIFPVNGTQFLRGVTIEDLYGEFEEKDYYFEDIVNHVIDKMNLPYDQEDAFSDRFANIQDQMNSNGGRLTVSQINKLFGKYIKIWEKYIKQYQKAFNQFYIYDGFHKELNIAKEEISLFGVSNYYALAVGDLWDEMQEAEFSDYQELYVGGELIRRLPPDGETFILRAIQAKKTIYYINVEVDDERSDW